MARFEGCDRIGSPGMRRGCLQCFAVCASQQQLSDYAVPAAIRKSPESVSNLPWQG